MDTLNIVVEWLNENEGVVTVLIFLISLFLGWVSGIFATLRRRPILKLALIPGPTLATTFKTGPKQNGYDIHRTAISVYLKIANVGSASTSIENVSLGFHWHLDRRYWHIGPSINMQWVKYRIFWWWLDHPIVIMNDFRIDLGSNNVKVYPSLLQGNTSTGQKTDTYLDVGRSTNGVVYFEQDDSWGGCFPRIYREKKRG